MGKVVVCGINTSLLPKLNSRETEELLQKVLSGDKNAREQFIVANFRLVLAVIKKFNHTKVSLDDLFQAGSIGLIKAIDNFDIKFNVKFSTYAVPMIIGEVKRILRNNNSLRVPRSIRDTAYQVLKTRGEIEKHFNEATPEMIAEKMQVAVSEVNYALDSMSDTFSLCDPVYSKDGDTLTIEDQLKDDRNTDEVWTDNVALDSALNSLNERERKIISLRYFLGKTQTEISEEVGISQAQISRIEKTALESIKQRIRV